MTEETCQHHFYVMNTSGQQLQEAVIAVSLQDYSRTVIQKSQRDFVLDEGTYNIHIECDGYKALDTSITLLNNDKKQFFILN